MNTHYHGNDNKNITTLPHERADNMSVSDLSGTRRVKMGIKKNLKGEKEKRKKIVLGKLEKGLKRNRFKVQLFYSGLMYLL